MSEQWSGWVEWHGGDCPVAGETMVEVTYRCGSGDIASAGNFRWNHEISANVGYNYKFDIVQYRVKQRQKDGATKLAIMEAALRAIAKGDQIPASIAAAALVNAGIEDRMIDRPQSPTPNWTSWYEWHGGKCPIAVKGVVIQARLASGRRCIGVADEFIWEHCSGLLGWDNLLAYRIDQNSIKNITKICDKPRELVQPTKAEVYRHYIEMASETLLKEAMKASDPIAQNLGVEMSAVFASLFAKTAVGLDPYLERFEEQPK